MEYSNNQCQIFISSFMLLGFNLIFSFEQLEDYPIIAQRQLSSSV